MLWNAAFISRRAVNSKNCFSLSLLKRKGAYCTSAVDSSAPSHVWTSCNCSFKQCLCYIYLLTWNFKYITWDDNANHSSTWASCASRDCSDLVVTFEHDDNDAETAYARSEEPQEDVSWSNEPKGKLIYQPVAISCVVWALHSRLCQYWRIDSIDPDATWKN